MSEEANEDKLRETHYEVRTSYFAVELKEIRPTTTEWFYSAWILAPFGGAKVPTEYLLKLARVGKKARHYHNYPTLMTVIPPKGHQEWKQIGYNVVLARRKNSEERIGFLYYLAETSFVMGVWPSERHEFYKEIGRDEVPNQFRNELKDLLKPKLWREVAQFIFP